MSTDLPSRKIFLITLRERDKEIRLQHSVKCPQTVAVYKVNPNVDCAFDKVRVY